MRGSRRFLWLGIALVVLLVAGGIARVLVVGRSAEGFAKMKTSFTLLGKPHEPKWGSAYDKRPVGEVSIELPPFNSEHYGRAHKEKSIEQQLASDQVGSRSTPHFLDWSVKVNMKITADGEEYMSAWGSAAGSSNDSGVYIRGFFDKEGKVLILFVIEAYRGNARISTFEFLLTPEGFVAVEDSSDDTS